MTHPAPTSRAAGLLPQPGHIFENKYRIVGLIGSGGFAQVYHAQNDDVERSVAIKILTPHEDPDLGSQLYPQEIDARFLREAKMISDLRDPRTITMYDFGRARDTGLLYMVFEFIDGTPLHEVVYRQGRIEPATVVRILIQVLQSLREAHAHGILHRDIKPANIMMYDYLGDPTHVKLLDFGIAKPLVTEDEQLNVTAAGTMMGTPRYMSPEQICGQKMGPAADIYSLGLVAYELLTGDPAISETSAPDIVRRQLGPETILLPNSVDIPQDLRRIIRHMSEKVLDHRYQTTEQVIHDLQQLGDLSSSMATQSVQSASGFSPLPRPRVGQVSSGVNPAAQRPANGFGAPQPNNGFSATPQPNSGFSAMPQPQFGGHNTPAQHAPPVTPSGNGFLPNQNSSASFHTPNGAMVVSRPKDTNITIERNETGALEVHIPGKPRKHSLAILVGAAVFFVLAMTLGVWILLLIASAGVVFAVGMMFSSAKITVAPDGWTITRQFLHTESHKTGSIHEFIELREDVDQDRRFLRLITEKKTHKVVDDLSPGENAWIASEVNRFIGALRG